MTDFLTDAEHEAIELAGRLYTLIAERVVSAGPNRDSDLAEIRSHVHDVQHAVMAQAAARMNPQRYRRLGSSVDKG